MVSTWSEHLWVLPHCSVVATVVWRMVSPGHITVTWCTLVSPMSLDIVWTISSVECHSIGLVIHLNITTNIMDTQSIHLCFFIWLEICLGKQCLQLSNVS